MVPSDVHDVPIFGEAAGGLSKDCEHLGEKEHYEQDILLKGFFESLDIFLENEPDFLGAGGGVETIFLDVPSQWLSNVNLTTDLRRTSGHLLNHRITNSACGGLLLLLSSSSSLQFA